MTGVSGTLSMKELQKPESTLIGLCSIITVLDNRVSHIPSLLAVSPTFDLLPNGI